MTPDPLREQMSQLRARIAGRPLDAGLGDWLNAQHGVGSATIASSVNPCLDDASEGWLCDRESGAFRYGRVFNAGR